MPQIVNVETSDYGVTSGRSLASVVSFCEGPHLAVELRPRSSQINPRSVVIPGSDAGEGQLDSARAEKGERRQCVVLGNAQLRGVGEVLVQEFVVQVQLPSQSTSQSADG